MEENIVICEKRDSIALVYDNLKMNDFYPMPMKILMSINC